MDYKATLNLPKTSFPMKAELPAREPPLLARWDAMDLYGQLRQARAGAPRFVLHDGPPYANGDIHIGHALNKVLKDLIVRYKTLRGFDAPYVPGWDCHGMPIEHQLFKELGRTKAQVAQAEFRQQARAYAERYVGVQRDQFKRLGVLGDWARPYFTMAADYELTTLRVFRELVEAGYITRGKKPVLWCPACETALAEAEVEYEDRQDAAIYVQFPVRSMAGAVMGAHSDEWEAASVVVWTTTPWTLPANVALCFHPDASYSLVVARTPKELERYLILATSRIDPVLAAAGLRYVRTIQRLDGKGIEAIMGGAEGRLSCEHPYDRMDSLAVTDTGVSLEEGTGVVHIATGHGQEDYVIGQRYGLEVFSPVDAQGTFTDEMPAWAGQTVWEANPKIVEDLRRRGRLLAEERITHSYPHCWRCKQPVIFRATPQWFLSIEHEGLRQRLLEAARAVAWVPPAGLNRMTGMLEARPDWCLSRQRYWGTPIPVLHCSACDIPLLDPAVIRQIEGTLRAQGVDAWFTLSAEALAPGARCPQCAGSALRKDTDILDVWFDSGVSHEAVLKPRADLAWPADLYLEGSDQHRGWFQVSLIPSVALRKAAPFRQVLTHGFVLDGAGRKMSKSLGNVIAPQEVIQRYGADILRLWVASSDYRDDVRISEEILAQTAESYRKLRNTFRYLLANLYDFQPARDRVAPDQAGELDRWAWDRAGRLLAQLTEAYERYEFHEVVRAAYHYCVVDLSAFYLDALKDRLYTEGMDGAARRCAQTVLYVILNLLVRTLAPILVATTEEVWQLMREAGWVEEASVHVARWPEPPQYALDADGHERWALFAALRERVMKALEEQRSRGVIGSPLEAQVRLTVGTETLRALCEAHRQTLAEAFVVSDVDVRLDGKGTAADAAVPGLVQIVIERAPGGKCQRCWKHLPSVGAAAEHPQLCARCAQVVQAPRGS